MQLGLVGWDVATGLGQYNQDLARHLGAVRWLVPPHPYCPSLPQLPSPICLRTSAHPDPATLRAFLDGLDWLLFVETPYLDDLPTLAREAGVRLAAIPMMENFNPRFPWVPLVDLMLPPTRWCEKLVTRVRNEFGFPWRVTRVPGSVDTERFVFRPRGRCQRFLFCNGHGGYAGRKGAHVLAEAARLAPEIPILLYSQTADLPALPRNVDVRPAALCPEDLYREGEVCIQPSRWEGMGLHLLEAQACGLPLVTTNGPPMREYRPYRLIDAVRGTRDMSGQPLPVHEARPEHLAAVLRELWHTDVSQVSQAARQFVVAHHSWQANVPQLKALLETTVTRDGTRRTICRTKALHDSADPGSVGQIANPAYDLCSHLSVKRAKENATMTQRAGTFADTPSSDAADGGLLALVPQSARRILDLGCGSGRLGAQLKARQQAQVYGVERNERVAERARRRLAHVVTEDVEQLAPEFTKEPFDCVVCANVLEYLREPGRLLCRAREWLVPGGQLIARIPNLRHHSVLTTLLDSTWSLEPKGFFHRHPLRYFTRREIEKLFCRAGFAITALEAVPGPGHDEWVQKGKPGKVRVGRLHIGDLPACDAEEFYVSQYLVRAAPAPGCEHGLISIILVTHNQVAYTQQCINSIRQFTDEPYELIVVDNASTDGTRGYLDCLTNVTVIANDDNRGFPAAVNQGIRAARGNQILLLNNDCVVTTGWLGRLLRTLHSDPKIGLVGPCSNCVSGEQEVPVSYEDLASLDGFALEWGKTHAGDQLDTDRLVGFCLLLRRELVDRIGLLDEQFGLGCFEDDDYCLRALQAGYRVVHVRDAFVHHIGGRTFVGSGIDFAALMRQNERRFRDKWDQVVQARKVPEPPLPERSPQPKPTYTLGVAAGGGLRLVRQKIHLSLCMIVRDSARTLRACLESIKPWVDEMIVVDTGSKDDTPKIAEEMGARMFHFPWCDSFSAARNESLRHARGAWIFWMDADDTITPENGRKLQELVLQANDPGILGYIMQVHCPGPGENGAVHVTVVDHVKLFRNRPDLRFDRRIHEQIIPAIRRAGGDIAWTDLFVVHSGYDHSPEGQERKLERDLRLLNLELAEEPNHPFTLFNLGMTYTDMGRYKKGIHFLQRSIAHSAPGESQLRKAYALLVSCYLQLGRQEKAWKACQEGLERFPRDEELRFKQAVLLHTRGQLREAVRTYRDLLRSREERHFTSVERGITGFKARHNLAMVYTELGDLAKAEKQWRLTVREVPTYREGWRGLGEVLLQRDKEPEVQKLVERLLRDQRLRVEGRLLHAQLAVRQGRVDEARQELEQALAERPDDTDVIRALCRILFEHVDPTDAKGLVKRLLRLNPRDASALHNLGTIYLRTGRFRRAVAAYRRSLRYRPDCATTLVYLGHALRDSGALGEAIAVWRQVLELCPGDPAATEALRQVGQAACERPNPPT